jgi:hypothetical protein
MIAADEPFDGSWPCQLHCSEAAGFRQRYIVESLGPGEWQPYEDQ